MVTAGISAEFDQHPAQTGFDGAGEGRRIILEDEPGINAEPRNPEDDGEERHPQQRRRRPKQNVDKEGDPVQPQHAASWEENRSVTRSDADGTQRQDGEVGERYDHDASAKSMTVCGVGEQVVSLVRDDRLADHLSGRLALHQAYSDFRPNRSWTARHAAIGHRPDSRPYLRVEPDLHCSISHSHRVGVAAVALAPIGIDIETIHPRHPALLDYIAAETEVAALRDLVESPAELLTLIWTLKEATAKASGQGLGVALRRLRVTATGTDTFEINDWRVVSYRFQRSFVGLAFQQSAHGRPAIRWYQPPGLPAAAFAEDVVGLETVEAAPLQRRISG